MHGQRTRRESAEPQAEIVEPARLSGGRHVGHRAQHTRKGSEQVHVSPSHSFVCTLAALVLDATHSRVREVSLQIKDSV